MVQLSEGARRARNAYSRQWHARNRDKKREAQARYWERKAQEWGLVDELGDVEAMARALQEDKKGE